MRLFSVIFLMLVARMSSAQRLEGVYREKAVATARTLTFSNGRFDDHYPGDLQDKRGTGSYVIRKHSLTLNYKPYPQQDSSSYQFTDLGQSPNIHIELYVFDSNHLPMFAYIGLRNNKNEPVMVTGTDKNGVGNLTLFDHKNIGYFTIDAVGYHRISIPVQKLVNKRVEIKAELKPQSTFYIEDGAVTYRIVKFTGKELVLSAHGVNHYFEKID